LLAQPDNIIPYTAKDETANKKSKPRSILTKKDFSENGITDHPKRLKNNVNIGAKINPKVFAFVGITVSLNINFKASAIGCNKPKNPTTLGPFLCCIEPITLR
jgi:hypothetical protein